MMPGRYVSLMFVFIIFSSLVSIGFASSFEPELEWSKTYQGNSNVVIKASNGGYVVAGSNASMLFYPAWERAPLLLKTDSSGGLQWNKTFNAVGHVITSSVKETSDGGFIVSGSNISPPNYSPVYSGWLFKTDEFGDVVWNRTVDMPLNRLYTIQTSNNEFVAVGDMLNGVSEGGLDAVLMKFSENGVLLWNKTFGGNSSRLLAFAIVEDFDGGYVTGGNLDGEGWLMKTDVDGNVQWSHTYSSDDSEVMVFVTLAKTSDGGFVIGGGNSNRSCLIKTDSSGEVEWNRFYMATGLTGFRSVTQTEQGYVAVSSRDKKAWLGMFDLEGKLVYHAEFGDSSENISSSFSSVITTGKEGFLVSGRLNSYTPSTPEGFQVTPFLEENVYLAKFAVDLESPAPTSDFSTSPAATDSSSYSPSPSIPEFSVITATALIVLTTIILLMTIKSRKQNPK